LGKLQFFSSLEYLRDRCAFVRYLAPVRRPKWVVYAKRPFAGPEQVLDYVGRYTHRVAISNNRLLDIENGQIRFRWKDYRNQSQQKTITLSPPRNSFADFSSTLCRTDSIAFAITGSWAIVTGKRNSPDVASYWDGASRSAFRITVPGLPRSARRTHWNFAAPVSGVPPWPHGDGRVARTPQVAGIEGHIMSSVVALARSRMPQVRSAEALGKPCPLPRGNLMLTRQNSKPDASQPVAIATSAGINRTATFFHRGMPLRSQIPGPFNTHSTRIVERFSPIHFLAHRRGDQHCDIHLDFGATPPA
jgi:hypothetical protein